jgi:ABC-2 type transport system ATP-binding protein
MVNLFYILDIYGFCYNEADSVISDFHSSGIEIGTGFSSPPGGEGQGEGALPPGEGAVSWSGDFYFGKEGGIMIEIVNLSKSYQKGAVKAVDNLNLKVRAGEIFGFLGPNGAGKTTTIKMMVGLLKPDSGSITINGSSISDQPLVVKNSISYVPETPEVYEKLTGIEYLNFLGDVYSVPGAARKEKIPALLDLFGLSGVVGDLIQSYSHGMRQKLVLVGALLHEPEAYILDEPMVGLDPRSSNNLKSYLRENCDRGKTVFFSTHILEVAERLCDRIGIIHQGKLIACGTMEELWGLAENKETLENIFLELTER